MQLNTISRIGIVVGLVAVLVCGGLVGLAFARDAANYDSAPQNTYCEGVELSGMDADEATEALRQFVSSNSESIVIHFLDETTGETYDAPLSNALMYDVDQAVVDAIELNHDTNVLARITGATPARQEVRLGLTIDDGALHDRISEMADGLRRDAEDAWREFNDDNTVVVHPEVIGRELDVDGTFSNARVIIGEALANVGSFEEARNANITVPLDLRTTAPYVTTEELPPAIIIDYSQFKLRVFDLEDLIWECSIGYGRGYDPYQNAIYDSPEGLHYIEYKDPAPVWTNPDPEGWGAGRPDSIGPGADSPLGLRALKISDAPMIFIHGVAYPYLIGERLSHGCINVYNDDVVELYDLIPEPSEVKSPVWVYLHGYPEGDYEDYVYYNSIYDYSSSSEDYSDDYEEQADEEAEHTLTPEEEYEYEYSYVDDETGEVEYYSEADLY